MRYFLIFAATLGLVAAPFFARAETVGTQIAPADEYFGRTAESILEIRNRIARFDGKSDREIQSPDALGAIDNVEEAVMDWQHKYPADPWVVDAMARLLECYARAGAAEDPHAATVLSALVASYPKSARTGEALLALADAMTPDDQTAQPADVAGANDGTTVTGEVVDAATGSPIPGAIVIVAPNHESSDVTTAPFATTGSDGSFAVKGVPLGSSLSAGAVSMQHAEYIVVEPPRGSTYVAYHGVVDAADGKVQAGIIRLAGH